MTNNLGRLTVTRRTGQERFHDDGTPLAFGLLDFWQWSVSDLVSNATRGRLAEYLVSTAIGSPPESVRDEWAAYDLTTPSGIKLEVKSGAYIQVWHQRVHSPIKFVTPKTRAWDPETNILAAEQRRQADVYVFALLAHREKSSIDPLNITQWRFYVLPTAALDARERSQHSITLRSLELLCRGDVGYSELAAAIERVGSPVAPEA